MPINDDQVNTKTFPPTYLSALLVLEIVLHFIFPIRQMVRAPFTYLGVILFLIGLALNATWTRYLERQDTTSDFLENASRLVVGGPFQRSRNPIYLSGLLLSLGLAIFLGSLITLAIPVLLFLILNSVHIPDEEARLKELFGDEYFEYKQRVRRWL
jgi:protein-S-isoprenylcysteine O-methyltransferase Ste14